MKLKMLLLVALNFVVLSACGKKDDDDPVSAVVKVKGSCDLPKMAATYKMCLDFTDFTQTDLDASKTGCEGGTFGVAGTFTSGSSCATTGAVGTCTWASGSNTVKTIYTEPAAAAAKTHCEGSANGGWKGTWTAAT